MTDIVSRANRLLENATPGPWVAADSDIVKESNGEFIGTISEYSGIDFESKESANTRLAAAAPELAAALAQETWEYSVQEKWHTPSGTEWRLASDAGWHNSYREADAEIDPGTHSRIVRRRVSTVEVCCQS